MGGYARPRFVRSGDRLRRLDEARDPDGLEQSAPSSDRRSVGGAPARFMALQQSAGNAAVARLVARSRAAGMTPARGRQPARASGPGRALQRQDDPARQPRDVVILAAGDPNAAAEARLLVGDANVFRVETLAEMRTALQSLPFSVPTVYVLSHSTSRGSVGFDGPSGTVYETPDAVATAVRGAFPADREPRVIDFRGCLIGRAPEEMMKIGLAAGAGEVRGSTCWEFNATSTPVTKADGTPITSRDQLGGLRPGVFDQGLRSMVSGFGARRNCILGLERGEADQALAGNRAAMAKVRDLYFQGGGNLVAKYVHPEEHEEWDPGVSVCYRDLPQSTEVVGDCQIRVVSTEPPPSMREMLEREAVELGVRLPPS